MIEQMSKKKKIVGSPSFDLSSLPDDMVLNCLSRVSRWEHGTLSLVSKSHRSLVVSDELYEIRSMLGLKEECIYVCLYTPLLAEQWFMLRRAKENLRVNRLIPINSFPTPYTASIVSLGWGIYVIGGDIDYLPTSRVSLLDCRTNTWSLVPSMRIARFGASVGVLDGKIYVMGGCKDEDPSNWAEVFDPKMQTWSKFHISNPMMNQEVVHKLVGQNSFFSFQSEKFTWNNLINLKVGDASCVMIDRLLYSCDLSGRIMWCDPWSGITKGRMEWYKVKGLEYTEWLLSDDLCEKSFIYNGEKADVWNCYMLKNGYTHGFQGLIPGFKLSKSGGNIVTFFGILLWGKLQIWCLEISLKRRPEGDIWGLVQCFNKVITLDPLLHIFSSINVSF